MFELAGSDVKLELVEGVVGSAQAQPQLVQCAKHKVGISAGHSP